MQKTYEPISKKSICAYCGDAAIPHTLSYVESLISYFFDKPMQSLVRRSPLFIKRFSNFIPIFLFHVLFLFRFAKLSNDITKAKTFRSRVIWEEAQRRSIKMEQIFLFGKPIDHYRARVNNKTIYFESIPIPYDCLDMKKNWDDKIILKKELSKNNIPVPLYMELSFLSLRNLKNIFDKFKKPLIVKPQIGSRGRHTITNIQTLENFKKGIDVVKQISPYVSVEEHLYGYVCRATVVKGVLGGFYTALAPFVVGDGIHTIKDLIKIKNENRPDRVDVIVEGEEFKTHINQFGYKENDILPKDTKITLSHRGGRLFGGTTREMIDNLHPSFIPILEKAGSVTELAIAGFDCIIPDPTKDQASQHWGIIECNTLPFIDLHYYALEGKPRNIAGMVWDMWK